MEERAGNLGLACRELPIEPIELCDEQVDALHRFLAAFAKLSDLEVLPADAPLALRQLAPQARDLELRPLVLVDQGGDHFFQPLEIVTVEGLGNRFTPAQAVAIVPVRDDGRQPESR